MNRKKRFLGAGLSTVLLVFVMLCLIVFAVLSLATARADLQMSRKMADRTQLYYEAQSRAFEKVKSIDGILVKQYNEEKDHFLENVWDVLQTENLAVNRSEDGKSIVCCFQETIDDIQQIKAELTIAVPRQDGDACYEITGWQVQQKNEWKADTGLPVMQRE